MEDVRLQLTPKGSVVIPIIIVILLLLGVAAYFITPQFKTTSTQPSQTASSVEPTSPVTDFAPNLPASQKSTVVIRTSDSSTVTYLVAKDQVDTFIKKLPAGDEVVSKSP